MDNIERIDISITSLSKNIELIIDNNVDNNLLKRLINSFCLWKSEYGYKGLDSEEFIIRVFTDKQTDYYHGKGVFPYNYDEFLSIVGELYE